QPLAPCLLARDLARTALDGEGWRCVGVPGLGLSCLCSQYVRGQALPPCYPCVFLGFVPDAPGWQFYHPTSRRVFPSQEVTFDESVPFYRLFPYRSAPPPPPPLFLAPDPLPGPVPVQVAVDSSVARGAASGGAASCGAEPGGAESKVVEIGGAEPGGVEHGGVAPGGAEPVGAASGGAGSGGAEPQGATSYGGSAGASPSLSLQQLREWFVRRTRLRSGATGAGGAVPAGAGGTGVAAGAGVTGGAATTGPRGARTRGTGAAETSGVEGAGCGDLTESGATSAGGAGAGGAGVGGPEAGGTGVGGPGVGAVQPRLCSRRYSQPPHFLLLLLTLSRPAVLLSIVSLSLVLPRLFALVIASLVCVLLPLLQPLLQAASPLPAPSPYTEQFGSLTEHHEPASCLVSPVRTTRRVPRSRPPLVLGTHAITLRPSSIPLRVPLPAPLESSLPQVPDLESDHARAVSLAVSRLLATAVTDPSFESAAASALSPESRPASPVCTGHRFGGLTERHEPASCLVSPVRTTRRVPRSRPPLVLGTHAMTLRPSSIPLRVPLLAPPESSLPEVPDLESDHARAVSPAVSRLLATAVTDPSFEFAAASALVAELLEFASACHLDHATALVAESASASPPSVGGECALGTDVLKDRQEDFECLATAVPRFASMLLAREGDPDAPDIPTPRSYAEAITGPYSSQWQAAMDAEMASWKSTGTYVAEVPPPGANIVNGIWILRVKRPPGSPPAFKARYVARGFSQRQGV
ncbi:unnamed protein product, partial [Closterium sp. NIES-53]